MGSIASHLPCLVLVARLLEQLSISLSSFFPSFLRSFLPLLSSPESRTLLAVGPTSRDIFKFVSKDGPYYWRKEECKKKKKGKPRVQLICAVVSIELAPYVAINLYTQTRHGSA